MEDDPNRAKSRGRPSSETTNTGRRPGEDMPGEIQPSSKLPRTDSHENRSSRESSMAGPSRAPAGERNRRPRYELVDTRGETPTKMGNSGKRITLKTNYFKLLKKPSWNIFQYRVDFCPDIEITRVKKGVLSEQKRLLGGYLFDGSTLFMINKLPQEITELDTRTKNNEDIKITIKFVGVVSMKTTQSLQVLNIILRRAMEGLQLQLVGRNFFDAVAKIEIREHHMQLWPGYVTSIRQHEKDILLCVEITHKVMRTDTLYDILQNCTRMARGGDFQEMFKRQVMGMIVLTDYNNKTYRVDDVDFSSNPKKTFSTKNGAISFIDYYRQKYHINIRDPGQPLILSRAKERQIRGGQNEIISLIPELCRATGLDESQKDNRLMQALSRHTRLNPDARINRLKTFNRRLMTTDLSTRVLKEWQMSLDENLVEVQGRILDDEKIRYAQDRKTMAVKAAWGSDLQGKEKMFTSVVLKRWHLIVPNRQVRDTQFFLGNLNFVASSMGMQIDPPEIHEIHDDRNHAYLSEIENCARYDPQMIMCVVPNNNAERYSTIKKKTCVERAIPTQVVTQNSLRPSRANPRSIATKVAIQMNCKLGAAAWMIEVPLRGLMTIGFDTSKSTKDKRRSFGALVATMDLKESTRFFSTVTEHESTDQLSTHLVMSITKALKEFSTQHNKLPSRILIYRDGVGEGQIQHVMEHEVNIIEDRLRRAYKSAGAKDEPKFAFIIVSRSNTRIFNPAGRNPGPGTVIDDVITLPERFDFFLVSQSINQGTVSPTNYNVVRSTFGLTPDHIQMITYKMTHLYYNWSGTTRVPAVCQYAHKLSSLVGQSIHQIPNSRLEKLLYYL